MGYEEHNAIAVETTTEKISTLLLNLECAQYLHVFMSLCVIIDQAEEAAMAKESPPVPSASAAAAAAAFVSRLVAARAATEELNAEGPEMTAEPAISKGAVPAGTSAAAEKRTAQPERPAERPAVAETPVTNGTQPVAAATGAGPAAQPRATVAVDSNRASAHSQPHALAAEGQLAAAGAMEVDSAAAAAPTQPPPNPRRSTVPVAEQATDVSKGATACQGLAVPAAAAPKLQKNPPGEELAPPLQDAAALQLAAEEAHTMPEHLPLQQPTSQAVDAAAHAEDRAGHQGETETMQEDAPAEGQGVSGEDAIGYHFQDPALLQAALTLPATSGEHQGNGLLRGHCMCLLPAAAELVSCAPESASGHIGMATDVMLEHCRNTVHACGQRCTWL